MEKKQIKRWWLLATEQVTHIEVDDDYYNHSRLFETVKPFWGTTDELVRYVQKHWFTQDEINLLKKGWQAYQMIALVGASGKQMPWRWRGTFKEQQKLSNTGMYYAFRGYMDWGNRDYLGDFITTEERNGAPYLKHSVLVDESNTKICLNLDGWYSKPNRQTDWTKTLKITCLDQDGCVSHAVAKHAIKKIGKFVTELQSTI